MRTNQLCQRQLSGGACTAAVAACAKWREPWLVVNLAGLVTGIVLVTLNFDAQKVEGMLAWVQDNKREGSVLFLVRACRSAGRRSCVAFAAVLHLFGTLRGSRWDGESRASTRFWSK